MAQGWHGDSAGHARAGRIGGRKSAQARRARQQSMQFGEQIPVGESDPADDSRRQLAADQAPADSDSR